MSDPVGILPTVSYNEKEHNKYYWSQVKIIFKKIMKSLIITLGEATHYILR